jgi:HAD superfamily hydrolase (TIGR01509 family)
VGEDRVIQAVLWDSDGVLVDTESIFFAATCEAFARVGVTLTRDYWARYYLGEGRNSHQIALDLGLTAEVAGPLLEQRNQAFRQRLQLGVKVRPDVRETLEKLHGHVRLAVVTGSTRDHFALTHRDSNLLPWFDLILTFEDYNEAKPHPAGYLMALQRLGLQAHHCLAVEDSPRGVRAAVAAGLRCILVPTELTDVGLCREICDVEPTVASVISRVFQRGGNDGNPSMLRASVSGSAS